MRENKLVEFAVKDGRIFYRLFDAGTVYYYIVTKDGNIDWVGK